MSPKQEHNTGQMLYKTFKAVSRKSRNRLLRWDKYTYEQIGNWTAGFARDYDGLIA